MYPAFCRYSVDEARDVRLVLDDEDALAHATDFSRSVLARPGDAANHDVAVVVAVVVVVVAVVVVAGGFGGGTAFVGRVSRGADAHSSGGF